MHHDAVSGRLAHARYTLARAWHSKGNLVAAIAGYREALCLDPGNVEAAVLLGSILQNELRLEEALQFYRQALERDPNEARFHKEFVNVLLTEEGPGAVFQHYRLARKDSRYLSLRPSEILCCTVVRNELPRLPYFLEYHRKKGIGAFFAVDNCSSDGTFEYLLEQPDVYLWQSDLSFNAANFGAGWFEPILRMHARGHWCLIADADEILYYPDCEHRSLAELCASLDKKGKRAFNAFHLDMYSDRAIRDTHYTPGRPFEEVCRYFDRDFYSRYDENAAPFRNQRAYYGGVRRRVFGEAGCWGYYLSKVPLLKYDEDCILSGGQHWTNLPVEQIAAESGCLLHFKYFSLFPSRVAEEARRKEHYGDAMLYQEYDRGMQEEPCRSFYDPAHSVKLEDSGQLVRLGIMHADAQGATTGAPVFPAIDPVPSGKRPFWSVILSVYRRTCYLEQALRSVLAQAPGPDEMQIEVVADGPDDSVQAGIEAMVKEIAGDRVTVHRQTIRAGHPEIFNIAVRRARGLWIHILHDDDWVAPGFYARLSEGVFREPAIGAAFCRHIYVDEAGQTTGVSLLERETPGLLDGWLERIAANCRLQTPSMVVRREAYERLGGYCPQARSAFDWEMWQRIAVHYPVWYEPQRLAFFRRSSGSETARLAVCGQQITDTRAVIEIARSYLPPEKADALSRRASEYYARFALDSARQRMESGDLPAAMAHLREAARCSSSTEVKCQLFSFFSRMQPPEA